MTPDGKSVYLGDYEGRVVVIDTATNQATPIATGGDPQSVAISADGTRAYVSDYANKGIMVIDTATKQILNPLFPVPVEAEFLAISPDGRKAFAGGYNQGVAGLDTATGQPIGLIATGNGVGGLAFVPDQSPLASFAPPVKARPGVPAAFSGSASSDPDGTVAGYAWQFGDGDTASGPAAAVAHTYAQPGSYKAILTVTDNEGCSVAMAYTGQTASCHGSPAAAATQTVVVKYPGVKVRCPAKSGPEGLQVQIEGGPQNGQRQEEEAESGERPRQSQGQGRQDGGRPAEAEESRRGETGDRDESAGPADGDDRREDDDQGPQAEDRSVAARPVTLPPWPATHCFAASSRAATSGAEPRSSA